VSADLNPLEVVFVADDVGFVEGGAELDFDEVERFFAGVADAVFGLEGDHHVAAGLDGGGLAVEDDFARARGDDPVFGAVVVRLVGDLHSRVDDDDFGFVIV